ncbi:MAG: Rieske 2Fe-2S domain-containing protein [Bacteroidia bacterium]|jgi:3-phenylpropionate/trans-cinnamate dioxygenase ferredoxin subunit|nr:Rieske 2Fe-2S domain-containing protein [Bacteroidia bacterium]
MVRFYKVYDFSKHGQVPQEVNSLRTIVIEDKKICLAHTQTGYYAVDNRCPHAGAILSSGWCENEDLVCPVHRYKYNLVTGRGKQGDYIETYPVEVRTDGVYIGLKKKWWQFF